MYKDDYILSTDPELSEVEIIEGFSHRWPLERTFQDCKQRLGLQDPEVLLPSSVRREAPFQMVLYSQVVLWYLLDDGSAHRARPLVPSVVHRNAGIISATWVVRAIS